MPTSMGAIVMDKRQLECWDLAVFAHLPHVVHNESEGGPVLRLRIIAGQGHIQQRLWCV